jgi:hypothetical protein
MTVPGPTRVSRAFSSAVSIAGSSPGASVSRFRFFGTGKHAAVAAPGGPRPAGTVCGRQRDTVQGDETGATSGSARRGGVSLLLRGGCVVTGAPGAAADEVLDCRDRIVIPGLVNGYTHAEEILQRSLRDAPAR